MSKFNGDSFGEQNSIDWEQYGAISSHCEHNACVEVARAAGTVAVRNTTVPQDYLVFPNAWKHFVQGIRDDSILYPVQG